MLVRLLPRLCHCTTIIKIIITKTPIVNATSSSNPIIIIIIIIIILIIILIIMIIIMREMAVMFTWLATSNEGDIYDL